MPDTRDPAPERKADSAREIGQALVYSYNRANANTREVHRANSTAGALAALLLEKGVIDPETLEQRIAAVAANLERDYSNRGMGVALLEQEGSKYEEGEEPEIDCASRWHLCKGSCCKLSFALSEEDVEEGVVRWDLRRPYVIARGAEGRCVHQEAGGCRCTIYDNRPKVCRAYDCRNDKRIWLDFERRIPNPEIDSPDWPTSVAQESGETTESEPEPEAPAPLLVDASTPWLPIDPGVPSPEGRPLAERARGAANRLLDRVVRARVGVLGRSCSPFQVWGYSGLVAAVLLGALLVAIQELSFGVLGVLTAVACATFLALAMATKIVCGEEKLIYYHHEVAILLNCGVALRLMREPLVPYLELTLLAVGMFLAWGRIGCLMVGCCHGRPHGWGVRYGEDHARDGFPSHLTGTRLFPIQLVESITVLATVIGGTLLVALGRPPGEALALYVMGYGVARFLFEFARGDADRPYLGGFSEAQWTSLLLMGLMLGAGLRGDLPLHAWHLGSLGLVAASVLVVIGRRHLAAIPTHEILHPHHLDEIARILRASKAFAGSERDRPPEGEEGREVLIGTTSQGFRVSAGASEQGGALMHYGLSRQDRPLTPAAARVLERLILRLEHPGGAGQLVSRTPGIFHLLVRAAPDGTAPET